MRRRPRGAAAVVFGGVAVWLTVLLLLPLGALVVTVAGSAQDVLTQLTTQQAFDA